MGIRLRVIVARHDLSDHDGPPEPTLKSVIAEGIRTVVNASPGIELGVAVRVIVNGHALQNLPRRCPVCRLLFESLKTRPMMELVVRCRQRQKTLWSMPLLEAKPAESLTLIVTVSFPAAGKVWE